MIHISKVNLTGNFQLSMEGQNVVQIKNVGSAAATITATDAEGVESTVGLATNGTYSPADGLVITQE